MTFEEFFKKKKINLTLLQSNEPLFFVEFKNHYEQMGEKSFDHTKKYWFNQLRRRFPAPVEAKVEKVQIENQIAEQTITEALLEATTPPPATGVKPRFKVAMAAKPMESGIVSNSETTEQSPTEAPVTTPGFKPRFKAAMAIKSVADIPAVDPEIIENKSVEMPKPAVGFKPRFNAAMVKKPNDDQPANEPEVPNEALAMEDSKPAEETPKPVVGFKPRFNAAKMKPKEPGQE